MGKVNANIAGYKLRETGDKVEELLNKVDEGLVPYATFNQIVDTINKTISDIANGETEITPKLGDTQISSDAVIGVGSADVQFDEAKYDGFSCLKDVTATLKQTPLEYFKNIAPDITNKQILCNAEEDGWDVFMHNIDATGIAWLKMTAVASSDKTWNIEGDCWPFVDLSGNYVSFEEGDEILWLYQPLYKRDEHRVLTSNVTWNQYYYSMLAMLLHPLGITSSQIAYGAIHSNHLSSDVLSKLNQASNIKGAYVPAGVKNNLTELPLLSDSQIDSYVSMVYNIQTDFVTTSDFLEGEGKSCSAGSDVAIVNTGTSDAPIYKYNVIGSFVDLSKFYTKDEIQDYVDTHTLWTKYWSPLEGGSWIEPKNALNKKIRAELFDCILDPDENSGYNSIAAMAEAISSIVGTNSKAITSAGVSNGTLTLTI